MLFPTLDFAIFFAIVFFLSWRLMDRATGRKLLLLTASYVFYGWWDWRFLALLAGSSLFNYLAGAALSQTGRTWLRKLIVAVAVTGNLAVLAFFKYFGFFITNIAPILEAVGLERDALFLEIVLPVGISFFTFQGISYVVDVARRDVSAVKSPIDLFLYISFFPQLVAGPIVRAAHFLPQLAAPPRLSRERMAFGIVLILAGLFKKMVVANYLAGEIVDEAFFDPATRGGIDLWLGVYAYAIQIYCDFSGYSDIGIGVAALLGYHFHANFNQPYRASSLRDFWRRWHISLSRWLRDYLYKPLGGSRGGEFRTYRNLMLTMLLGGLWHGAAWTFVVWGLIHGAGLAIERWVRLKLLAPAALQAATMPAAGSVNAPAELLAPDDATALTWPMRTLAILCTFHAVCLGWIFFRAADFGVASDYLAGLFRFDAPIELATPFTVALTFCTLATQFLPTDLAERIAVPISRLGFIGIGLIIGIGIWFIEVVGPEGVAPFIYFQF